MIAERAPKTTRLGITQTKVWTPLERQDRERDTVYLLDPLYEKTRTLGQGALQGTSHCCPWDSEPLWEPLSACREVAGKFRTGLRSMDRSIGGYAELPLEHMPVDEFTIEFWLSSVNAWAAASSVILNFLGTQSERWLKVQLLAGLLQVNLFHKDDPSGTVNLSLTSSLTSLPVAAGEQHHIAVTLDPAKTLRLLRQGIVRASQASVKMPPRGFQTLRIHDGGADATDFTISDLRISRKARTPGLPVTLNGRPTLTVDPTTPTGDTVEKGLLGILHRLETPAQQPLVQGKINVVRTDKLLVATPIKAGAVDGTHPSAGHSGAYSYDWQVVDRSIDAILALGCQPYISIDATPQILGGSVAPFSGALLTTGHGYDSNYPQEHPSDLAEFAKIVGDLVYHMVVEKGYDIPYFGVWNEPDGNFWSGANDAAKRASWMPMYAAVANAVKAIDPTLKVGGPETSNFSTAWIDDLVAYCKTNAVPLDFISWHLYSGDPAEAERVRGYVEHARTVNAFAGELELLNGESNVNFGGQGVVNSVWAPNGLINRLDYAAGYMARVLISQQRAGVKRMIWAALTDGVLVATDGSHKWAQVNVYEQWQMLNETIIDSTLTDAPPWLDAVATKNGDGSIVDVFLGCWKFDKVSGHDVVIQVPVADGTPVRVYVVDDQHSNYEEAGPTHADLESYEADPVEDGQVTIRLRPRSSALVRIGY